ncbi:MAG: carboxypeptidase-like regulatory domain-containing protein [Bacteroidaceae bacterium]|nr:carboxypeptidase-like regulatory domain-containing protein [Bacteroidaceae bacterium]
MKSVRLNINSRRVALYVLSVLLFLLVLPLSAQQRSRIFGMVTDEKGSPVELANVRVQGTAQGTVTNLKGEYSFYCASADTVTVVYSMIGYETR